MAKKIPLKGFDKVVRNLRREVKKIEGRTMKGLIRSAIVIRRDMDKTPPLIPVDEGNLRASWTTNPFFIGSNPAILMMFTAEYAVWVHENEGATFKRPNAGAKFFEASLKRNAGRVLGIIQQEAKVR